MINLSRYRTVQRIYSRYFAEELVLFLIDPRSIDGFGFEVKAGTRTTLFIIDKKYLVAVNNLVKLLRKFWVRFGQEFILAQCTGFVPDRQLS